MKTLRILTLAVVTVLSMSALADKSLSESAKKAQTSLVEYLRLSGITPSIDARDQSVCFKKGGVFYWVTFDESSPVLYTLHRKGIKFDNEEDFKPNCALYASNQVNRKYKVKCFYKDNRVDFMLQTYAKEPSSFHACLNKMIESFDGIENSFREAYDACVQSIPVPTPPAKTGSSPMEVTYIAFANFDGSGNMISDYNQPLRKNELRYVRASIDVESSEKGLYKIGLRIVSPDGKALVPNGQNYSSTTNIEIKKKNKTMECDLEQYGSDEADFWKAGEYKVEIYDFEKNDLLYSTTFNVL